MIRFAPLVLLTLLSGCSPRRLTAADGPPPDNSAEASFVALGAPGAVLDAIAADLRLQDCLAVERGRDSTGVDVLVLTDPCPGQKNRALVRVVDDGDGMARGTVVALFTSASAGRSLATLPSAALYRQDVPAFAVPVPSSGGPACMTIAAWRAGLDASSRMEQAPDSTLDQVDPVFVRGFDRFVRSIRYPSLSRRAGIEGRTVVRFVVDATGAVTCADLMVSLSPELNAEALRAVRAARFVPGTLDGRPVPIRLSIPITFRIR